MHHRECRCHARDNNFIFQSAVIVREGTARCSCQKKLKGDSDIVCAFLGRHPNTRDHASGENLERRAARIGGLGAEFLFDAQLFELPTFSAALNLSPSPRRSFVQCRQSCLNLVMHKGRPGMCPLEG
jgi:hypothetical protein